MIKNDKNIDFEFDEREKAALKSLADVAIPSNLHEKMMSAVMSADRPKKINFGRIAAAFSGVAAALVLVIGWVFLWNNNPQNDLNGYNTMVAAAGAESVDMDDAMDVAELRATRSEDLIAIYPQPPFVSPVAPVAPATVFVLQNEEGVEIELSSGTWATQPSHIDHNLAFGSFIFPDQHRWRPHGYHHADDFVENWGSLLSNDQLIVVREAGNAMVRLDPSHDGVVRVTIFPDAINMYTSHFTAGRPIFTIETFDNFYANMLNPKQDSTTEDLVADWGYRGVFFRDYFWRPHNIYEFQDFFNLYGSSISSEQIDIIRRHREETIVTYVRDDGRIFMIVLQNEIE